jgi:hypothetical protein
MSGMACIDTDHCDLTYDDQVQMWQAEGFECVIYTTAHNTHGDRYRVIVPFSEPVDPATHDKAVRAICRTMSLKWSHDAGKSSCYSLFYFPGQYDHYYLTKKTDRDGNVVFDKITGEPKWEARSPDAEPKDDDIHCKVENHFTHLKGHIASAEEWIDIAPPEPVIEAPTPEGYPISPMTVISRRSSHTN